MSQKLKKNSNSEVQVSSPVFNYKCGYCEKTFMSEYRYVMHTCKEKVRWELLSTILGQNALKYYECWHKMCNRVPPHASTFLVSTYFQSFVTFAEFVKNVKLPNPSHYMRIMIEKKLQPPSWTRDDVYVMFIETMDNAKDPIEHITISLSTILSFCEKADLTPVEFFQYLTPPELAQLIRQRHLSPWLLLNSSLFKNYLLSCNESDQQLLEVVIRPDFWKQKFLANPDGVKKAKKYIKELGF